MFAICLWNAQMLICTGTTIPPAAAAEGLTDGYAMLAKALAPPSLLPLVSCHARCDSHKLAGDDVVVAQKFCIPPRSATQQKGQEPRCGYCQVGGRQKVVPLRLRQTLRGEGGSSFVMSRKT
jgi:hypothetical protein